MSNVGYRDGYCKRCEDFRLLVGFRVQTPHVAYLAGFAATGTLALLVFSGLPALALPFGLFGGLMAVFWFVDTICGIARMTKWRCNQCGLVVRPSAECYMDWMGRSTGEPIDALQAHMEAAMRPVSRKDAPPPVPAKPLR